MVVTCLHPINLSIAAVSCRTFVNCRARETTFVQTPTSFFGLFTLRFLTFLPSVVTEFTEYKLSKCVPLSRPTRVLSVIPVTGAPILHGKATTPMHHRSLDSHRKAPTPSQNQPPHRPPGQKTVLKNASDSNFPISDFSIQFLFMSSNHVRVSMFAILLPRFFHRQNSRMGITAFQLNSRCMNTHLPTSSHLEPPYNIFTIVTRDDTFNDNKTIQLGTSPLLFATAPRRAIATTTTCIFRGPTLTPRHHLYLPHNLNPHGRCHNHQLHPFFPRHNHRHTLIHNHNHFNHHRFCPTLPPLH